MAMGESAVLGALELPPPRGVNAPTVAVVARRRPCPDLDVVDPKTDVGGPVGIGARNFGRQLKCEFKRRDRHIQDFCIVGELVFDMAASKPNQPSLDPTGFAKQTAHVY